MHAFDHQGVAHIGRGLFYEQHGAAAEAVLHGANQRREQEQHRRIRRREIADDGRRLRFAAALQMLDELWPHGDEQAEAEHIEQDREEDETQSRSAAIHRAQTVAEARAVLA